MGRHHKWKDFELEILKNKEWSDREIADMLGITVHTVQNRRYKIKKAESEKNGKPTQWMGCNQTCPDYCPYDECLMPATECAKEAAHYIVDGKGKERNQEKNKNRDKAPGSKAIRDVILPGSVRRSIG